MTDSERAELRDYLRRVWEQMGGVGTLDEFRAHSLTTLPNHLRDYLVTAGLDKLAGELWRTQDKNGMPFAPLVDRHGTHKQLELMDVGEFRFAIAQRMNHSIAMRKQAQRFADYCLEVHGVLISLADPFAA